MQIRMPDRPIKWIERDTGRLPTGPNALQLASRSVTTYATPLHSLRTSATVHSLRTSATVHATVHSLRTSATFRHAKRATP